MRSRWRQLLWYVSLLIGSIVLYQFFQTIIGVPVAAVTTLALVITWVMPHPWRGLLPLSILGELFAITPPLAVTFAVWAPLLIFWLRGRVEADLSFSYVVLVGASAALSLTIVVGLSIYPDWLNLPWPSLLLSWGSITVLATGVSLFVPALYRRFLHDRYL